MHLDALIIRMRNTRHRSSRRRFLNSLAAASTLALSGGISTLLTNARANPNAAAITKPIPSTSEMLPVIGMGTWITFNVGKNKKLRNHRTQILSEFFNHGGGLIDCSPMYGTAADVLGYGLNRLNMKHNLFSAEKVWTSSPDDGIDQIYKQKTRWRVNTFDLLQIHNLRNWKAHLETLQQYKADKNVRYIGVTTSHGRRHSELEQVLLNEEIDFVQFTYNIIDREVEQRLLPIAYERGIAVIANRPYRQKQLFRMFADKQLPTWAKTEAGANNWAEFFLKFIISHPGVTCAIPATSQISHMIENMNAAFGILPDQNVRVRMLDYIKSL